MGTCRCLVTEEIKWAGEISTRSFASLFGQQASGELSRRGGGLLGERDGETPLHWTIRYGGKNSGEGELCGGGTCHTQHHQNEGRYQTLNVSLCCRSPSVAPLHTAGSNPYQRGFSPPLSSWVISPLMAASIWGSEAYKRDYLLMFLQNIGLHKSSYLLHMALQAPGGVPSCHFREKQTLFTLVIPCLFNMEQHCLTTNLKSEVGLYKVVGHDSDS